MLIDKRNDLRAGRDQLSGPNLPFAHRAVSGCINFRVAKVHLRDGKRGLFASQISDELRFLGIQNIDSAPFGFDCRLTTAITLPWPVPDRLRGWRSCARELCFVRRPLAQVSARVVEWVSMRASWRLRSERVRSKSACAAAIPSLRRCDFGLRLSISGERLGDLGLLQLRSGAGCSQWRLSPLLPPHSPDPPAPDSHRLAVRPGGRLCGLADSPRRLLHRTMPATLVLSGVRSPRT